MNDQTRDLLNVGDHARGPRPIEMDLLRDAPPDLAIEVDISRSSRNRETARRRS